MSTARWQFVNVAALVAVLVMNGLAGSGALSGESIGVIANRYPSYFLPAGWTFGIWTLIYLWTAAFAFYQAFPDQRRSGFVDRIGPWWAVSCALNVAWIVAFSFSYFAPAMVAMVALLVTLVVLGERLGVHRGRLWAGDRLFGAYPMGLYLAWISVALIANTFQYAEFAGWSGGGIPGRSWAVAMMGVATALGIFMVVHRGVWLFPLVVAWALAGIADRWAEDGLITGTVRVCTVLGVVGLGAGMAWRRAKGPPGEPGGPTRAAGS